MKTILKAIIGVFAIIGLAVACDCICGTPKDYEDPADYLHLGLRKHLIHGYVDEHGHEHTDYLEERLYKIRGHYYSKSGGYLVHLGDCETCKQEQEELVKKYVGELGKELSYKIDSLYTEGKKTTDEIKTIVRQNTQRTIREVQKVLQKQE